MNSNVVPSTFRSTSALTLAFLTVAALGMTTLLALLPDAGHDQLWLLLAARRMLAAHTLNPYGPTVFESNPPLAIWLSALVVTLARLLHLSLTITFKLAVTLLALASALVSARLLSRAAPALSPLRRWLLAIGFVLIFGALPARDFGQRDQLLTLLILPYLFAAARHLCERRNDPRHSERSEESQYFVVACSSLPQNDRSLGPPFALSTISTRLLITLSAALGLALKPHQALIPLAVELYVLLKTHKPRLLEPAVLLLAALTYFAAIHRLAPTYLTEVLPILRDTYWAFGHLTLPQLLLAAPQLFLLAAITLTLFLRHRSTNPVIPILLAAATAATLAYLLQETGWYYQQLPAISLFALALTLQLLNSPGAPSQTASLLDGYQGAPHLAPEMWARTGKLLPTLAATLTLLTITLTLHYSNFGPQPTPDPAFFAALPPSTPVATLTTSVDDTAPPTFRHQFLLAQRYPHLWMLPAILRNQSGPPPAHPIPPARLAQLDRLQHRFMVEDLTRWRPTLILVQRCQDPAVQCQVLEDRHDDLLAFFLRDPAFAAIFSHYRLTRTSGPYDAYTLH